MSSFIRLQQFDILDQVEIAVKFNRVLTAVTNLELRTWRAAKWGGDWSSV